MEADAERRAVVAGSVIMVVVSLALFFAPALNGMVAGIVGGYRVGEPRRALMAALLPAVVVGLGLLVLLSVLEIPVLGALGTAAVGAWVVVSVVGLLFGALIGGLSGNVPTHRGRTIRASGTA